MNDEKRCSKCGEVKPLNAFYKHKSRRDGLSSECKPCTKERNHSYYVANVEKDRERHARWRAANREHYRERKRAWRAANIEKARASERAYQLANAEKERKRKSTYRAINLERIRESQRARYAANIEKEHERNRRNRQTYREGERAKKVRLRGGSNWPSNLGLTCASCNLSKNDKLPHSEWVPLNPLIRREESGKF